ncbi:hypothetical protein SAMN05216199_2433 [Pedococcus cremeus]|jgi:hypothetical protein|uniref:Uncharacterized protein n=2 Tax=Pedococcus cremeus TaxID=587636 RepID=A0A1H9VMA2_9MICO|nr:hypothetical protein SAMN05216199_2433 [Pedococcus cremeus]
METQGGLVPDPAEVTEVAHATAAVLVGAGRSSEDPEVTTRLVALVDELGLSTLAELWADRPARSLPGALWRLYALHEWVQRSPEEASADYTAGVRFADVNHVVAGVAEPPGPQEIRSLADSILRGVFEGDLAVALERAGAFCRVVSSGRADRAHTTDVQDAEAASTQTRRASSLLSTAEDLEACARLWRADELL